MRLTNYFSQTLRDIPTEAKASTKSHQLMLRANLIKPLASGLYTWTPMGLRVLRKVEAIVRKHMDAMGAQELLMPIVQPAELWQQSNRWQQYGAELLRLQDRHQQDFCLAPTHEEVITNFVQENINSYKQLPLNFYQIHTKFRDEIRPRFGVMRAREFIMKDAYSFHLDQLSLQKTYDAMYRTYSAILTELTLNFRAVVADSGNIGGNTSHEFHVLAESGEDTIAFSDQSLSTSEVAANVEAFAIPQPPFELDTSPQLQKVATPNRHSVDAVSDYLGVDASRLVKTLIVETDKGLFALVIRGDHQLSKVKAEKLIAIGTSISLADAATITETIHSPVGFIGPIGLSIPIIVDYAAAALNDFICGANTSGYHYQGVSWHRDVKQFSTADIREVCAGDPCPDGSGRIVIAKGIEVGHIFQLGDKYSLAMKASITDQAGVKRPFNMGCYGIGISRIVAAAIEQNYDEKGIIWPAVMAPFQLALIPINAHKSALVKKFVETLYEQLQQQGIEVLYFDQEKARLGELLADAELYGFPHQIIVGERDLKNNKVEYRQRRSGHREDIDAQQVVAFLQQLLC